MFELKKLFKIIIDLWVIFLTHFGLPQFGYREKTLWPKYQKLHRDELMLTGAHASNSWHLRHSILNNPRDIWLNRTCAVVMPLSARAIFANESRVFFFNSNSTQQGFLQDFLPKLYPYVCLDISYLSSLLVHHTYTLNT